MLRQDGAAGGAGLHQAHRLFDPGLQGGDRASRGHQKGFFGQAAFASRFVEAAQVAGHLRLHISVGADRRQAGVFADFGADVGRQRDPQLGRVLAQQRADAAFVVRVGVAMQQADRHTLHARFGQFVRQRDDLRLVQGRQHAALRIDALGNAVAPRPRYQRLRLVQENVVLREPVFQSDLDQVAEARRRQQGGAGALALDERVGGKRGAQDQQADPRPVRAGLVEQLLDALQHGGLGRVWRGEQLGGPAALSAFQHDVGEGAADIDSDAHGRGGVRGRRCWHMRQLESGRGGPRDKGGPRPVMLSNPGAGLNDGFRVCICGKRAALSQEPEGQPGLPESARASARHSNTPNAASAQGSSRT
ncbi:hypothetical protein D9M68_613070 [compost metagenome]